MTELDPDQIKGLAVCAILVSGVIVLLFVMIWQSFHCVFCNRWLTWKRARNMDYTCENKGQCRLAELVRSIRKGEI
jgi:hypothetical protein